MTNNESQIALPARNDLVNPQRRTLIRRGHSVIHPDVYVFHSQDGTRFLMKDMVARPAFMRRLAGWRCLRHEYHVLKKLRGQPNIPHVYGMPDRDALALEYFDAVPLPSDDEPGKREVPGPEFFERLKRLVRTLHEHGIAHGDIRRKNVLWDVDHQAYLIDFGTAVCREGSLTWLRHHVFQAMRRVDEVTVLKLQAGYCPTSLTPAEKAQLASPPWYLRLGRFMRRRVYRPFIKQKRWRKRLERFKNRTQSG